MFESSLPHARALRTFVAYCGALALSRLAQILRQALKALRAGGSFEFSWSSWTEAAKSVKVSLQV